jgi:phosphoribosylaminoimidazole-succinocarboxamide synthase
MPNLQLYSRGKVRDTYEVGGDLLLVYATDGISIFDFVLNALVPDKGKVLTALNYFWCGILKRYGIRTHLFFREIPSKLSSPYAEDPEEDCRLTMVRKLAIHPVEFIARGILTGSAYKEYANSGAAYGHILPSGLEDGDSLPFVMDTPTTKEIEGHDQPLIADEIRKRYPEETHRLIQIFQIISSYASERGIRFVDTKLEFGLDKEGNVTVGDEIGTGDSSRFCDEVAWRKSREPARGRKLPPPLDKQLVRAWGIEQGIHELDPKNPDHVKEVHALTVPAKLIRATTQTYRYLFWRLTGRRVESYWFNLGVRFARHAPKIAIVAGSENDLPDVAQGLRLLADGHPPQTENISVHVVSCHRNPEELRGFAKYGCRSAEVILAVGGKAFALPGVLDAMLHSFDEHIPVVGVALGKPGAEPFEAARLSIKELPGAPVVMDELSGTVYSGPEGIAQALRRILTGELPPPPPRPPKPARFDIPLWEFLHL